MLSSRVNGDNQFKIYLSTQIASEGLPYHNGWGWPITCSNTLRLPQPAANKSCWLYIWVQSNGVSYWPATPALRWGPMPLIDPNAHWISDPAITSLSEAWFGAHIRCK